MVECVETGGGVVVVVHVEIRHSAWLAQEIVAEAGNNCHSPLRRRIWTLLRMCVSVRVQACMCVCVIVYSGRLIINLAVAGID